jgi:hypothetical protein
MLWIVVEPPCYGYSFMEIPVPLKYRDESSLSDF